MQASPCSRFAVLRVQTVDEHVLKSDTPFPYDSSGLPPELVSRLESTYSHAVWSREKFKHDGMPSIRGWTIDKVPIYTMLNWITASGWMLHNSSVTTQNIGHAYQSLVEHYFFTKPDVAAEPQTAAHVGDKRKAEDFYGN